jgi:polygalacturonase
MRGPQGAAVGTLKRIIMSNITCFGAVAELPSIISGVPGHMIEDIKIDNVYLHQLGGGSKEMAALQPEEKENAYPEPRMFGTLPASGFFIRHVKNIELGNIEIATEKPDVRPAFWLDDVDGADFFRVKAKREQGVPAFALKNAKDFRAFGSSGIGGLREDRIDQKIL